jgi:hypothetical protein
MVDAENIPESESYKQLCYARARYHLQDKEIESAFELIRVHVFVNCSPLKGGTSF